MANYNTFKQLLKKGLGGAWGQSQIRQPVGEAAASALELALTSYGRHLIPSVGQNLLRDGFFAMCRNDTTGRFQTGNDPWTTQLLGPGTIQVTSSSAVGGQALQFTMPATNGNTFVNHADFIEAGGGWVIQIALTYKATSIPTSGILGVQITEFAADKVTVTASIHTVVTSVGAAATWQTFKGYTTLADATRYIKVSLNVAGTTNGAWTPLIGQVVVRQAVPPQVFALKLTADQIIAAAGSGVVTWSSTPLFDPYNLYASAQNGPLFTRATAGYWLVYWQLTTGKTATAGGLTVDIQAGGALNTIGRSRFPVSELPTASSTHNGMALINTTNGNAVNVFVSNTDGTNAVTLQSLDSGADSFLFMARLAE